MYYRDRAVTTNAGPTPPTKADMTDSVSATAALHWGWQATFMRLRDPGGVEAALATVKQVKDQLWNANAQGHTAADRKDDLLSWSDNWASPQLGNHFAPSEVLFAELAESYHRLVLAPQMTERQLNGLVSREWRAWDARLERVIAELQSRRVFLSRPGHLVVTDTSAFMEGKFFTDFDWHTLDKAIKDGPIRLIVPSLVIEELDELKRHRDGRQKAQARRVLRQLWELHRARPDEPAALPAAPDVTIEVLLEGDWHQRRPNNDGEIIDQTVITSELTGRPVILVAADYTQLYRAAPLGLTAVLMPRPDEA